MRPTSSRRWCNSYHRPTCHALLWFCHESHLVILSRQLSQRPKLLKWMSGVRLQPYYIVYCMYIRIYIGHLPNLSYTVNIQYMVGWVRRDFGPMWWYHPCAAEFLCQLRNVLSLAAHLLIKIDRFSHFWALDPWLIISRGTFSHGCTAFWFAFGHSCMRNAVGNSLGDVFRYEGSPKINKITSQGETIYQNHITVYIYTITLNNPICIYRLPGLYIYCMVGALVWRRLDISLS